MRASSSTISSFIRIHCSRCLTLPQFRAEERGKIDNQKKINVTAHFCVMPNSRVFVHLVPWTAGTCRETDLKPSTTRQIMWLLPNIRPFRTDHSVSNLPGLFCQVCSRSAPPFWGTPPLTPLKAATGTGFAKMPCKILSCKDLAVKTLISKDLLALFQELRLLPPP